MTIRQTVPEAGDWFGIPILTIGFPAAGSGWRWWWFAEPAGTRCTE
jgi:hypothetical protein